MAQDPLPYLHSSIRSVSIVGSPKSFQIFVLARDMGFRPVSLLCSLQFVKSLTHHRGFSHLLPQPSRLTAYVITSIPKEANSPTSRDLHSYASSSFEARQIKICQRIHEAAGSVRYRSSIFSLQLREILWFFTHIGAVISY